MPPDNPFIVPESESYYVYLHAKGKGGRWTKATQANKDVVKMLPIESRESAQRMVDFGFQLDRRVMFNGKELFK